MPATRKSRQSDKNRSNKRLDRAACCSSVRRMKLHLAALLLAAAAPALAIDPPATVLQNTVLQDGLLPVHVDRRGGRILLSLPAPDADGISGRFIYVAALETG